MFEQLSRINAKIHLEKLYFCIRFDPSYYFVKIITIMCFMKGEKQKKIIFHISRYECVCLSYIYQLVSSTIASLAL